MVLAVPEPAAAAMTNLKILYQLGAALGSSLTSIRSGSRHGPGLRAHQGRPRHHPAAGPQNQRARPQGRPHPRRCQTANGKTDETAGKPPPPAERNPTPSPPEKIHASRTIINHVLTNGEGVLSTNAMTDRRFSKGKSVHNLGIRSALCAPIKARKLWRSATTAKKSSASSTSTAPSKITPIPPTSLRLLTAIGLQAGMAVSNAQLYQAGPRRPNAWPPSAKPRPRCPTASKTSSRPCAAERTSSNGPARQQLPRPARLAHRRSQPGKNLQPDDEPAGLQPPARAATGSGQSQVLIDECLELIASDGQRKRRHGRRRHRPGSSGRPADPDGIHQVMMNLLSNALDAVEPQGASSASSVVTTPTTSKRSSK
jgi:two-component system, NtrC family, sensor kinase